MRSLTYELTTIYADQIQQQKGRGIKELHYPQLPISQREILPQSPLNVSPQGVLVPYEG